MADLKYELAMQDETAGNDTKPDVLILASKKQENQRLKPKQKTRVIIIICVLLFIILLLLIGIIVIGVALHNKASKKKPSPCLTLECTNTASDVMSSVDSSVDPCDDFYQYACGKWPEKNPRPEDRSVWDPISKIASQNQEKIKQLFMGTETRVTYSQNEAFRKVFDLYDSCADESTMVALGGKPLLDVINSLGSCPGLNSTWNESSWDFNSVILKLNKHFTPSVFFKLGVYPLDSNSSVHGISLQSGGLSLRPLRYNSNHSKNMEVKEAYKGHMIRLLRLLGLSQNKSNDMMQNIFSTETSLAEIIMESYDKSRQNTVTLKEMDGAEGKKQINWLNFLTKLFEETGFQPTEDTKITVESQFLFNLLNRFLYNASKRDLADYIMWRVINHYSSLLSKPFRQSLPTFYKVFRGTVPDTPRWETCLAEVKDSFGMAIGRMFVEEVFRNGSKAEASEMIGDIKEIFIKDFDQVDWMDEKTKAVAKEKAKAINEHVGYPEYIMDNKKLADMYKEVDVKNDTYFLNFLSIEKSFTKEGLEQMGNPVNKKKWGIAPTTVNAVYVTDSNSVDIPAGILQRPLFSETYTSSINFGGIGSIIGHEITHGFDNIGRKYNQNGNIKKWWSNTSIENFNANSKCFVDQYSNFTYLGESMRGQDILAEVIADNGGTEIAFKAYLLWVKVHGEELMLPGINLSHEQIFFLSYAQIFCSSYEKESAKKMMRRGGHPINPIRVRGVLVNSKEFAKSYKCPVGSPMNPAKKCKVW